ncbi:TPA: replication protein RepA [Vibrio parahaemolyticus]|nr:replication protein RepA [Vibrio parahaemolyticus]
MTQQFNELEYRQQLIAKGVDPAQAFDLARRTAEGQGLPPAQGVSHAEGPAKQEATKKAPAKRRSKTSTKKADEKPRKAPTKAEIALIDASAQIMETPPTGNDLAFNHGILCQVGLPRSKVNGDSFLRRSGDAWVHVQAGLLDEGKGPVQQLVPYGAMPRLALAWVSTYAVRHKTAEIPIGESAAEFLRMVGKDRQGARYKTLRTQMHALAACRLQMGFKGRTYNAQPVEHFDAWVNDKDSEQRPLWPGTLRLSDSFYNILMESPVPLDNRALDALSGSALALDIYCWLAHRLHRIEGRPVTLHWHSIREQFAQEYKGKDADKDFKKKFLPALHNVQMVYPDAKVKQVNGGLLLMASPPPVPYKG